MQAEILVVHPATTIIQTESERHEVPTGWFPVTPKVGQRWELNLDQIQTLTEQYAILNQYLGRG